MTPIRMNSLCYEATVASPGGDETTLTKSFIISLEGTSANWYARMQMRSIHSWHHLREEFLVNFQGFQMELSVEEDFLSCESLPDLCQRFVWLKAQAPEVSDYQVIT
jgi:hypothetical protein